GFAMEREEIFAAPSAFPELAKEVESLMEQSSLVTAQVSSMLEHKQTEPVVEIAESKEPIPLSLKIMGGLAGLLTLLTLLIYPAIKTADTDEPDSQVAVGQAHQGITQPAGGKPKAAQTGVRKSEGESNPATQNKGLSQPAVPEKSGSDSPPEKAGVNSNDSEPDPTNQEQKQLANQSKGTRTYVVQSGDSLWKISERLYGSGFKFYLLISANGIATPSELNTGMVLMVPPDK
ncbi:MAG TPA: LysM peptidoglycan-binding domain-containing protein, partial [Bacillota bacterium]|nr:LysM peptidoglycan-binding domain-containing protein [Bacillota bacterium]